VPKDLDKGILEDIFGEFEVASNPISHCIHRVFIALVQGFLGQSILFQASFDKVGFRHADRVGHRLGIRFDLWLKSPLRQ